MGLINYTGMEPLFQIAANEARLSPCSRRQYGAVIGAGETVSAHNERITKACDDFCIRDQKGIKNGHHIQTELGAEIHAEAAALIKAGCYEIRSLFVLVGFIGDKELLGEDAYPCLWCAKMIKYAGFSNVYLRDSFREIRPYSIEEIIEYWEYPYEAA